MKTIPLTCYIRTLDEADRIGPVVSAAAATGAEVIVIDSGSTDGTRTVAQEAGARVIEHPWAGNGFQKRVGEDAASNGWLLDLDADEVLGPDLQQRIRALFADGPPRPGVYALRLVTVPPFPKNRVWEGCNIAWRNKLYHKSVVRMPESKAWDQFELPAGIAAVRIREPLKHYSFRDIEHQMAKMNRVSSVRAREAKLKSKPVLVLRILFGFPVYLFKKLVLHGMYRGGIYGFACAAVIASNRWLRDVKMYEIHLAKRGRNTPGDGKPT